jgi:hypothetical protein
MSILPGLNSSCGVSVTGASALPWVESPIWRKAMGQMETVMSELGKELGVTRQTLYQHIGSDGAPRRAKSRRSEDAGALRKPGILKFSWVRAYNPLTESAALSGSPRNYCRFAHKCSWTMTFQQPLWSKQIGDRNLGNVPTLSAQFQTVSVSRRGIAGLRFAPYPPFKFKCPVRRKPAGSCGLEPVPQDRTTNSHNRPKTEFD